MRRHLGFIIFFTFTVAVFLSSLITMKSAFLGGDYMVQFYPWSKIYSEAIKSLRFPFWSRYFHSGFPLMAEGQIGGFYPLNIIMFFLLPFKIAYNYSIILHFILAGIFTYAYARKIGAGQLGGALAVLTFCFGSAYAGCFYNIATLRTLVWFPLVLLLMEKFLDSNLNPLFPLGEQAKRSPQWGRVRVRGLSYIVTSALIAGIQFLAGFLQMAVYSFVFYIIYLFYGFRLNKIRLKKGMFASLLFVMVSTAVALPQVLLTHHLAQASGRASVSLDFALWKSFPPPCILSIFFPRWLSFLGHQLFIGVLSILFLIYAIMHSKGSPQIRPLVLIGAVALLAALGRYNPLYVALLKITGFYSFRNPSKFLFFASFAGSVLSGFGFSKFFSQPDNRPIRSAVKIFFAILAISASLFFIAKVLLHTFKDMIITWLQDYVLKYVFGKPYHRYDLQTYMDKAHSIYLSLQNGTNLSDIFVGFSVVMVVVGILLGIYIYIKPDRVKLLKHPVLCLIFLDIFVYSFYGTGFRGNIKPFEYLRPTHIKILEILKSDKELFRILPFDLKNETMPYWARPNANVLYGLDSIAAYTPLASEYYRSALLNLEVVDDALGVLSPSNEALVERYQLLRLLNVKYIISSRKLDYSFLKEIVLEEGIFLYKMIDYLPRAFFTYKLDKNIRVEPLECLEILEYRSGFVKIKVTTNKNGFLVFSENYYPGWKAYLDEELVEIIKVKDIAQAVRIDKGLHRVVFRFRPSP